jgi:hypothetical protein
MCGAMPLLPQYVFMAWCLVKLPSTLCTDEKDSSVSEETG